MTSETITPTLQACRECGAGAPPGAHFCGQCGRILPLGRKVDYFAFFAIPRKLHLDAGDLERRFRALSRQFHPDYFHNATLPERRASLERSSYLNDAYRTLKNPAARLEYLLGLEGLDGRRAAGSEGPAAPAVPPDLLEEVFELNEELDAVRELRAAGAAPEAWRTRLERARAPIEAKRDEHEAGVRELSVRWDALADAAAPPAERRAVLEALRERALERNYINNLLSGIDRELNA